MSSQYPKVAMITGAGRGIGRATAIVFAKRGIDVVVNDMRDDLAEETAHLVEREGVRAVAAVGDVSRPDEMRRIVDLNERALGGIDILVNNAGIASDRCPLEAVTEEMFERSMAIHVRGTLFTTQAVIPGMKRRRWGRIVNISSVQGLVGWTEGSTYNAAKGAVLALAKGWAKEFAPWNICVNAVAPGHTETEMTVKNDTEEVRRKKAAEIPLGRYAQPVEMAEAIAFLASPKAGFITGQVLSPNGGFIIT